VACGGEVLQQCMNATHCNAVGWILYNESDVVGRRLRT